MSIFEQKRNKQVFEIIVILKIIYIILSMIQFSKVKKRNKKFNLDDYGNDYYVNYSISIFFMDSDLYKG